jgi:hypothetical protein
MSEGSSAVRAGLGGLLAVLGALWVLLSGGCTLYFLAGSIPAALRASSSGEQEMLTLVAVIGSLCVAPGAGLLWVGIWLLRRRPPSS